MVKKKQVKKPNSISTPQNSKTKAFIKKVKSDLKNVEALLIDTENLVAEKKSIFLDPIKGKVLVEKAKNPLKQAQSLLEIQNAYPELKSEFLPEQLAFSKKIHDHSVEKTIKSLHPEESLKKGIIKRLNKDAAELEEINNRFITDEDLLELEKKLDIAEGKEVKQTQDERFASLENDIIMATEKFLLARRELAKAKAKLDSAYSSSPFSDSVTTISSL